MGEILPDLHFDGKGSGFDENRPTGYLEDLSITESKEVGEARKAKEELQREQFENMPDFAYQDYGQTFDKVSFLHSDMADLMSFLKNKIDLECPDNKIDWAQSFSTTLPDLLLMCKPNQGELADFGVFSIEHDIEEYELSIAGDDTYQGAGLSHEYDRKHNALKKLDSTTS